MIRRSPRGLAIAARRAVAPALALAAVSALFALAAAPRPAAAEFRCAAAFDYHANRCASSQITSISKVESAAVCGEFTQRISTTCRKDWDKFKTCAEFAQRFERLLVDSCKAKKVASKSCRAWGEAYAAGELNRCERGKFTY
jgi:hypothetical protein